jgi:glucose-1-phosphate cytidylyltransferase
MNSDFTIELNNNNVRVHKIDHAQDWSVTLADTDALTMTGARLARAAAMYLGDAKNLPVMYGDGAADADLLDEFRLHVKVGNKIATVLGVNPPSRFGEMRLEIDEVVEFAEKTDSTNSWINGVIFSSSAKSSNILARAKDACCKEILS